MGLRIAIDAGGSFTDVAAFGEAMGAQFVAESPGTPADPSIGLLDGVGKVLSETGYGGGGVSRLLHGSTATNNAVLEHEFGGLGPIVSSGCTEIFVSLSSIGLPEHRIDLLRSADVRYGSAPTSAQAQSCVLQRTGM